MRGTGEETRGVRQRWRCAWASVLCSVKLGHTRVTSPSASRVIGMSSGMIDESPPGSTTVPP